MPFSYSVWVYDGKQQRWLLVRFSTTSTKLEVTTFYP